MSVRRVLITAGAGFVGANLARRLVADGQEVHLLVRPGSDLWRLHDIQPRLRLHSASLDDRDAVVRVVRESRPEWVFHLAASGAYSWQHDVQTMIAVNFLGLVNLVDACVEVGFESLVAAGSSSEYGFKDHAPGEEEWLDPNSDYAVTKAAATLFCRWTSRKRNARVTTLRLYSVYGPYEDPRRLMPVLLVHGLRGELPPLVNPEVAHDFVYIEDVVDAFLAAADRASPGAGAVYNVGAGVEVPMREVVETARRLLGLQHVQPVWGSMPDRPQDSRVWVADVRRIQAELGWRPVHSFEQGLRKMLQWFRDSSWARSFYESRWSR